jgi:hypothetical protein
MLLIIFNFKARGFKFLNINRESCYELQAVAALNLRNQLSYLHEDGDNLEQWSRSVQSQGFPDA